MSHVCMETNSEGWLPPISRCCGLEVAWVADGDTAPTFCPECDKLSIWQCPDCGVAHDEWLVVFDSTNDVQL